MSEKQFSIRKIKTYMENQECLISDEEAFLRHLMRKWKDGDSE